MFSIKKHEKGDSAVTAICDVDLVGKKFEEGELQLDVSERFYKGDEIDEVKVVEEMKDATILNLVGKNVIELALKNNIINKDNILYVDGVPHAEVCSC